MVMEYTIITLNFDMKVIMLITKNKDQGNSLILIIAQLIKEYLKMVCQMVKEQELLNKESNLKPNGAKVLMLDYCDFFFKLVLFFLKFRINFKCFNIYQL